MDKASIAMRSSSEFSDTLAAPLASEIDELAERSESLEQRIASLNDSYETLKKREVELTEWRWVLREAGGFFDRVSTNFLRKGFVTHRLISRIGPHPDGRHSPILRQRRGASSP
jgi:hypothetical protein